MGRGTENQQPRPGGPPPGEVQYQRKKKTVPKIRSISRGQNVEYIHASTPERGRPSPPSSNHIHVKGSIATESCCQESQWLIGSICTRLPAGPGEAIAAQLKPNSLEWEQRSGILLYNTATPATV
jgi:hypothetical protein